MANRYATKDGLWSDVTVWDGGASLPAAGDIVFSNGKVVTIDGNYTVTAIKNQPLASPAIVAGGYFTPQNGTTLTLAGAKGVSGLFGNSEFKVYGCYYFNLPAGESATVVGDVYASTASSDDVAWRCAGVVFSTAARGALTVVGNLTSSAYSGAQGANAIRVDGSGVLTVTGNLSGASRYPGAAEAALSINGPATVTVNGNLGTSSGVAAFVSSGATVVINGDVLATSGGGATLFNTGNSGITVNGNLIAGSQPAFYNSATGATIRLLGSITASTSSTAVSSSGSTLKIKGPLISSSTGKPPIYATQWVWDQTATDTYYETWNHDLSAKRTLYTAGLLSGQPASNDVRNGTVYGPSGDLTGTMVIPPIEAVAFGVPVDASTGTAALSPIDFWNTPASQLTLAGSMGSRLRDAATVHSTSAQLAALK